MRRPDLPLIIVALALGAVLAIFADGGEPTPNGPAAPTGAASPLDSFYTDPALAACLGAPAPDASPGEAPRSPADEVERVARQVERLRKVRFAEPVDAHFLTPARLRAEIGKLLAAELPEREVTREGQILELLGAIAPGTDLAALQESALDSQVVGLYDPKTKRLLVQAAGKAGPLELITLSHELTHALADQRLGLRSSTGGATALDRELAYLSVLEGDATLVMERYTLANVGLADQLSLGGAAAGVAEFDALPDYVQRELLFPYLEGLRLVCHRWNAGGWGAVNRLYEKPPASTDEVIFPARYGNGPPANPHDVGEPAGWRLRTRRELGPAELEWLLSAPGGDPAAALPEPRRFAAAWAGGELELWSRGGERALGISLAELPRAELLCGAMAAWYGAGHPDAAITRSEGGPFDTLFSEAGLEAALSCRGDDVRLGIAPDGGVARELAG